jgi:ATP-dependent Clp protease ATP-binding subunit ClpA
LRNLERNLKPSYTGRTGRSIRWHVDQDVAFGLGDQHKPVGSFLFAGPTGVGKTEVTRQLALTLGVELIRFDMSEYMERHTVSRLIGRARIRRFRPGWPAHRGDHQASALRAAAGRDRKAHPDVFNLPLQAWTTARSRIPTAAADFRHVVIVMTTNMAPRR